MTSKDILKPQKILTFGEKLHDASCFCVECKRNKRFDCPSELVDLFVEGKVVLFIGAGASTEAKDITHDNFYETISYIINNKDFARPFSEVMETYCSSPAGKVGLIEQIKRRFDYIYAHRTIYEEATRFHHELSTFFPIDTIITTNWDTYFEDECAATPFVEDKDIALWDVADRKVLKLHGTIANFGSIVATKSDYQKCKRRLQTGVLGAHLKSLLATRSTIFIGYSLRDEDFLQVYNAVRRHLADFHRRPYFVAPSVSADDRKRLEALNIEPIETDGQFFISQLKRHAQKTKDYCPDSMYANVADALDVVRKTHIWLHKQFDSHKFPQILFCSWYQDGLLNSLERILRLRKTGVYSDRGKLVSSWQSYQHFAAKYFKDKNYSDSAYCEGYANGYLYAALSEEEQAKYDPPLFFYFGFETTSRTKYRREIRRLPKLHMQAFRYAKKVISKYPSGLDMVLDHADQLDLGPYLGNKKIY